MDHLYEKIVVENIFYEIICWGSEWVDKNIFDGININLSKLTSRLNLRCDYKMVKYIHIV